MLLPAHGFIQLLEIKNQKTFESSAACRAKSVLPVPGGPTLRSSVLDYGRSELAALPEELKSHRLFSAVQEEIDNIEVDLNLIESLKEAAIRPRHWEAVFRAIEWEPIVPHTQLTFKQLMEMMLHARAQKIMDITAGADKELKIETDLIEIEKSWKEMRFDVRPYSKAKSKKHTQTTYVLCAVEEMT